MCSWRPGENSTYSQSYTKKSYVFGLFGSASGSTDSSTTIAPTFVSAVNDVRIVSHADLVLKGSGVQAGGSIFVDAQNVQITGDAELSPTTRTSPRSGGSSRTRRRTTARPAVTFAWQDTQDRQQRVAVHLAGLKPAGGRQCLYQRRQQGQRHRLHGHGGGRRHHQRGPGRTGGRAGHRHQAGTPPRWTASASCPP